MWILVAEALGALGLFLFIVWWTLGPTQRRERDALQKLARDDAERRASDAALKEAPQRRAEDSVP